jgi:charged multivesicular body protein 3
MLAKQIVQSRRAKTRLYEGRAQLNSVQMQLQNQISVIKVAGCMQSSAEVTCHVFPPIIMFTPCLIENGPPQVMSAMNAAIKIPEVQKNMFQLAKEMERAGLMEEIVADGLDSLDVRLLHILSEHLSVLIVSPSL